eukprot:2210-Heterococcus_DN1.PRE.5
MGSVSHYTTSSSNNRALMHIYTVSRLWCAGVCKEAHGDAGLTGINSVILYSTSVFALAGISRSTLATAAVSIANVIATLVAQGLVDKRVRAANTAAAWHIHTSSVTRSAGAVAVSGCLSFIVGYAIGFGAVGWTYVSEVVPSRLSVNWGSNLIISSLTLTAIELLGGGAAGVAYLYLIFAAVSACAVAFVHACVQETMGRSLEELQMSTSRSSSATGAAVTDADDDEFDIQSSIAATAYRPLAAQSGGEQDDFDRHLQEEHV